jgi:hypothetical protein
MLYPRERNPGTHWIGGWVGHRAGLDTEARGEILCLSQGLNLGHPVISFSKAYVSYIRKWYYNLVNYGQ